MAYQWIIDALDETWCAIDSTLTTREESAFDAPTPCPGWSVRDVLSHVIGFELLTSGAPTPRYEAPWPAYVRNELGQVNEAFVASLRHRDGLSLLALFRDTTHDALARLAALDDDAWEKIGWSPEGERPLHRFQETRLLDSWVHLGDIRDALGDVGDVHGPGEEVVLNRFESAMPYVFAKRAGAPEGASLRVNLRGRLARSTLLVLEGGRAVTRASSGEAPDVELTTSTALFWRRAAGRIGADELLAAPATEVRGDLGLAARFVEGLRVMI